MIKRILISLLAAGCAACSTPSQQTRLAIPVVDKSTRLNDRVMLAAAQRPIQRKPVEEPAAPAAVFVPAKAKPIEQKITFVSDSNEWANQQKAKAPKKPAKAIVTDADLDGKIVELQAEYQKGDADAAYQLVGLLLKRKRVEEAETVLDYAARQRHVPSMLLYGRYYQKIGDKGMARKWLQAASDAGSKEATKELKAI